MALSGGCCCCEISANASIAPSCQPTASNPTTRCFFAQAIGYHKSSSLLTQSQIGFIEPPSSPDAFTCRAVVHLVGLFRFWISQSKYPVSITSDTYGSSLAQRLTDFSVRSPELEGMAEKTLFSSRLVSTEVKLPHGYTFRPLQRSDYKRGHLDPLHDLAFIGEISEESWIEQFDHMAARDGIYYVLVILKDDKIVGTGTLVAEKKLYEIGCF